MHSYTIKVNGMRIQAPLGWYAQEQATGNTFVVKVVMRVKRAGTGPVTDLGQTVDYSTVYPLVKACLTAAQPPLLERAVEEIGEKMLANFELIDKVKVEVVKSYPAMGQDVESVAVSASFFRPST